MGYFHDWSSRFETIAPRLAEQLTGTRDAGGSEVDRDVALRLPDARWVEQRLDHFDFTETRKWSQRYFVNDTFYDAARGSDPVVFLCVGGEGPAFQPSVVRWCRLTLPRVESACVSTS